MIYKTYTVYDSKAECYAKPFFGVNKGEIVRSFSDIANDKAHPIGLHPEDYTLFEIGEFDEHKGTLKQHQSKISLGTAIEFKKEK